MSRHRPQRTSTAISWSPQNGPQLEAIMADWCGELFYGGAAGGGKSDYLLGDFLQDVPKYGKHWTGILFRRTYNELEELIRRSRDIYPASGAIWHEQSKTWTWANGAMLRMRYIERDNDATRYQGHQYTWIGWDELTQWPSDYGYRFLRGRLRSAYDVPTKRIRAAANPGGVGHHWVKAYFVDPAPGGFKPVTDPVTQMQRMFIPARLRDNKILLNQDPHYGNRLKGLASDAMVRAWLEGDWTVIEGAFFDCWRYDLHVLEPFSIPTNWSRFRSMDWGSAKPFSVGWWAVAGDDHSLANGRAVSRGALVRYREWYGAAGIDTGLKMTAEAVAEGIVKYEKGEFLRYGVLDPACFKEDGGPSIAERLNRVLTGASCRPFHMADNARVPQRGSMGGWDQMRSRLVGQNGLPMIYCFSTHADSIRTIPALQHDPARPEDVATESEDHCFAAGTLVETVYGQVPIEKLPSNGWVYSRRGLTRYRSARLTRRDARVVRLGFAGGIRPIVCTPDHKFWTDDGWCEAAKMEGKVCRLLSAGQFKNFVGNATTSAAPIFRIKENDFTGSFGSTITALFQRIITFITETAIPSITPSRILNVSLLGNITPSGIGLSLRPLTQMTIERQQDGIGHYKGMNGIKNTMRNISVRLWSEGFLRSAFNVVQTTWLALRESIKESTVGRTVGRVHCESVVEVGRTEVFCITVTSEKCFLIEGGFLVSNCGDEWRYACMSRPFVRMIERDNKVVRIGYKTRDLQGPGDWKVY